MESGEETNLNIENVYATLKLDLIAVKGKKEAVAIYTLLGDNEMKTSGGFENLFQHHNQMLEYYFKQDWDAALNKINICRNLLNGIMSEYYDIMITRIQNFKTSSPGENWNGVYIAETK